MVGLDTGFFVGLMKGDSKPVGFWSSLAEGDNLPVVSMLTLGELLYISFRLGQPNQGGACPPSLAPS